MTSSSSNHVEVVYLVVVSSVGIALNLALCVCLVLCPRLRDNSSPNAFVLHGIAIDVLRCLYCVPFALGLQHREPPILCQLLGGSYVILVTASVFNTLAAICCEAYAFSRYSVSGSRYGGGAPYCVAFGLAMVYTGSTLIQLGPTIIGGDFAFNQPVGNCHFIYGSIKSYVGQAMWVFVLTGALVMTTFVLSVLYRHVQANSSHRLASLVRASVAVTRGDAHVNSGAIQHVVVRTLSRIRVLATVAVTFVACWYPLFCLSLADPYFNEPHSAYRALALLAWSNGAINPLVFFLLDYEFSHYLYTRCCRRSDLQQSYTAPLFSVSTVTV